MRITTKLALVVSVLLCAMPRWALAASAGAAEPAARPAGVSESWWSQVEREISEAEYYVTWQERTALADLEASWQAPNRAQGLRTYFTESGIRVIAREQTGELPAWEWQLALAGWGRPGSVQPVEAAHLRVDRTRIEYDRGGIIEWYVNEPRGLEQGFTLLAPPPQTQEFEEAARFRVQIDLALGGTLAPVISEDGQAIDFATPKGLKVLHYAALAVRDALGRELRAWMEGFSGPGTRRGIRIVFEDADAAYPVTVDPLATTFAWTAESDQTGADFGWSVATAGDVNGDGYSDVIVDADLYDNGQMDEGRAFVYHGSAAGLAASPAWTAEGDQAGAHFGFSVATAGDVNGDGYSDVIVSGPDRAFVYHGSAVGLAASAAWTAVSDQAGVSFGYSVATAGDVNGDGYSDVIVGARGYTNGEGTEGRAFVYQGSAAGLAVNAAWTAESDQAGALFGTSVATAGDVNGDGYSDVIVGAVSYDNGQSNEGRAFVYHGSAAGLATSAAWTAESNQTGSDFGLDVATAGDVNGDGYSDVIVGAGLFSGGQTNEGRAYVYLGSATGLATIASWIVEGNQVGAEFGHAVGTAGDVNGDGYSDVIVGAESYDNDHLNEGGAFVYQGSAGGLAITPAWSAESNQTSALFGVSASTAGDVNGDGYSDVIVGAEYYDNGQTDEGRAFVYHGSAAGLALTEGSTVESDQADAYFGSSVATAGDVNGDGYADVIVGAPYYDNGQDDEGRAYVFLGAPSGLATNPVWTVESDQADAFLGESVATAGDVNGDGYADVIVGADLYDNGQTNEGRAYVYHGSAAGLAASASWTAESNQAGATFGWSVGAAGDVNGDGYADVIVGAPLYSNGSAREGGAFVYHGSAAGLGTSAVWTAESNQANGELGESVATAGDVNGDGYSDVIVGAETYTNGQSFEGRAYVYHGSAVGLGTSASWTAEGDQFNARFGQSVATAGDVNGDGFSDVIAGAAFYDNGQTDEGRAYVYHGSAAGLSPSAAWTAESNQAGATSGWSVGTAGDVNGDGYADVIVGAYGYDNGQTGEGRAFVYHGSAAGLSPSAAWTAESNQEGATSGWSVGTAGDVNGDGYADVIVGSPTYTNVQLAEGRVFVYYGNDGPGLSLRPQQRRATDTGPIAHLGASDSPDGFRLALLGRTPFGRGKVKLEWEVKPLGSRHNGIDTQTAIHSTDTGTSGGALSEPVVSLFDVTPYHWRVRLRYDAAATPFQRRSRWLTVPWGGWNETMLRTGDPAPAGDVAGSLTLAKGVGVNLTLDWEASCGPTDTDYAIYEGTLGDFTSHASRYCSTGGATARTFTPLAGDTYYLIVPLNATREGSYGTDSSGAERPVGQDACLPQQLGACE